MFLRSAAKQAWMRDLQQRKRGPCGRGRKSQTPLKCVCRRCTTCKKREYKQRIKDGLHVVSPRGSRQCQCGVCRKCRHRARMRRYRAELAWWVRQTGRALISEYSRLKALEEMGGPRSTNLCSLASYLHWMEVHG